MMEPYYFQTPDANLFGVFHQPRTVTRTTGVLLCYPLCQEYLSTHRACRQLSTLLSEAGFPVLRFDYYGCGDSGGSAERASIDLWLHSISAAAGEVKARAGVSRLCVVGLRFGATLAMMSAARTGAMDSLVLWDPIVRGNDYLADLGQFHSKVLEVAEAHSPGVVRPPVLDGLSLFGFQPQLHKELAKIDLLETESAPARNMLLIESTEGKGAPALAEHLTTRVANFQHQKIPAKNMWNLNFDLAIPPREILSSIVHWVSGVSQ